MAVLLRHLLVFAGLAAVLPANAASTPWQENQGGAVRLVTAGPLDAQGRLRGVIDIFLKPGWKTYWRDPGAGGVPPSLDVSAGTGVESVEIAFPAPERHDDGYGAWVGYGASVALPVTFKLAAPEKPARIEADLFLGVCETICVPVQGRFSLDTSAGDEEEDLGSVEAAFAALPRAAGPAFELRRPVWEGATLRFEIVLPEGSKPIDLFLAGSELGYAFGRPAFSGKDDGWQVRVPVHERPADASEQALPYTLVTDRSAVSGTIPAP